jgi:hypothetical protein
VEKAVLWHIETRSARARKEREGITALQPHATGVRESEVEETREEQGGIFMSTRTGHQI